MKNEKKTFKDFLEMFWFILKISLIGFGGGNALMPVIKSEAVEKKKWLTLEEFDRMVIITNMLPGPSVIQSLNYIAVRFFGKWNGTFITLIAILPHVGIAFLFYFLINLLPINYLYVISVGVLSVIVGILIVFALRYLKMSKLRLPNILWISLFLLTFAFCFFIPNPYNVPIVIMILIFIFIFIFEMVVLKINKNKTKRGKK
ncbi:chromate transporter [Mycoplasmopsis alligatoris]|nr:chromate transporter [Mycoplasmopsis alligatoris]